MIEDKPELHTEETADKQESKYESALINSIKTSAIGASVGLIGGIWLQLAQDRLVTIVPLLIALPALNAMVGDLSSIIASHIADPDSNISTENKLYKTLLIVVPLSAAGVILTSLFIAHLQEFNLSRQFVTDYSLFIVALFAITILCIIGLSIAKTRGAEEGKRGLDQALIPLAGITSSVLTLVIVSIGLFFVLT